MPNILVKEGSFAVVGKHSTPTLWHPVEFVGCRERFQAISNGISRWIVTHKSGQGSKIAAFMDRFEGKLKLKKRSLFGPTHRLDVSWIIVPRWWVDSHIRRSLYTALLRAARCYKPEKDNFEAALFANCYGERNYYTRQTRLAVERFLKGYTKLSRRCSYWDGWWDCFYDQDSGWYREWHKKATGFYHHEWLVKP